MSQPAKRMIDASWNNGLWIMSTSYPCQPNGVICRSVTMGHDLNSFGKLVLLLMLHGY